MLCAGGDVEMAVPFWAWVVVLVLAIPIALYAGGRILPIGRTGRWYLKKLLWKEGVDWRSLPDVCIGEFVEEAKTYAKAVCATPQFPGGERNYFYVEFDRMLKLQALAVAAAFRRETPAWPRQSEVEVVLRKHGVLDGE